MKDEIKGILDNLKDAKEKEAFFYTLTSNEVHDLLDYITNLKKENNHLKQNKKRTLEYIENNRIREKCIVDVNTLEGLLNER